MNDELPKTETIKRGDSQNGRPQRNTYQEGTADDDGSPQPDIPGPGELPEQQKVGERNNNNGEREHVET